MRVGIYSEVLDFYHTGYVSFQHSLDTSGLRPRFRGYKTTPPCWRTSILLISWPPKSLKGTSLCGVSANCWQTSGISSRGFCRARRYPVCLAGPRAAVRPQRTMPERLAGLSCTQRGQKDSRLLLSIVSVVRDPFRRCYQM